MARGPTSRWTVTCAATATAPERVEGAALGATACHPGRHGRKTSALGCSTHSKGPSSSGPSGSVWCCRQSVPKSTHVSSSYRPGPYQNVVSENSKDAGGWGGDCTCPDGQVYQVGDVLGSNGGELACVGGEAGMLHKKQGPWSGVSVICSPCPGADAPATGARVTLKRRRE